MIQNDNLNIRNIVALKKAISIEMCGEVEAIANYTQHIYLLDEESLSYKIFNEILKDEKIHLEMLRYLYKNVDDDKTSNLDAIKEIEKIMGK